MVRHGHGNGRRESRSNLYPQPGAILAEDEIDDVRRSEVDHGADGQALDVVRFRLERALVARALVVNDLDVDPVLFLHEADLGACGRNESQFRVPAYAKHFSRLNTG